MSKTDKEERGEEGERRTKSKSECCGYPLSIFFIVINEFCERFSYYGMRAVLVLYFRYFLLWGNDQATTVYHAFVALCYLTPILGAIIADSWLGKFKTIIYLSIVYTIGQVVMAVSALHDITDTDHNGVPNNMDFHIAMSMVGLILIALGTGGIKPCVSAFGGDQFEEHQDKQRTTFFSIFYLSINAGSLLSTIITPSIRATNCGINFKRQCYSLAFGIPAILMAVSLVVFIAGSKLYTKNPPKGNIMLKVCKCIGFAIKNRFKHRSSAYPKREHWMDWAHDKYDKLLVAQVKMVLKVLFLYIPLPMFWALFDQQGSRWTLQATTMDGDFNSFVIQPDQMQTVNAILIVIMVPIMDNAVYPLIKKCGLNFTPLRKITVGMFLAALAFVAAALLQIQIDKTLPKFPMSTQSQVKFINLANVSVPVTVVDSQENFVIPSFQATEDYHTFNADAIRVKIGNGNEQFVPLIEGKRQTVLMSSNMIVGEDEDLTAKPEEGNNDIRFVNGFAEVLNVTMGKDDLGPIMQYDFSNYTQAHQGTTKYTIRNSAGATCNHSLTLGFGSSYTMVIMSNFTMGPDCSKFIHQIEDIKPNTVNMAWQIPQYFLLTCGEVVFSVTGLEFSYSQAPSNMKAVLQAGWLLTVAVGNIIVLIVAEAGQLPDQWAEYVLFASLLVCVCIIFSIMAHFYTYMDPAEIEARIIEQEPDDKEKKNMKMKGDVFTMGNEKSEVKQTKI